MHLTYTLNFLNRKLRLYSSQALGHQAMFISASGVGAHSGGVQRVVKWLQRQASHRFKTTGLLAMVCGMPNVGKSQYNITVFCFCLAPENNIIIVGFHFSFLSPSPSLSIKESLH